MSHFSEYQVRRFRFLFNQYAEDAVATANVEVDGNVDESPASSTDDLGSSFSYRPVDIDPEAPLNWRLTFRDKLSIKEMHQLLPRLGPEVSICQVRQFIYTYDTSCTGTLDFDDFLEFLADYELTLELQRQKAISFFQEKMNLAMQGSSEWAAERPSSFDRSKFIMAEHFISAYPTVDDYLASLSLDDPEFLFKSEDSLTYEIKTTGLVTNPQLLKRRLVVRVCAARNLLMCARMKKRAGVGIFDDSMDPVIRVTCAGLVRETAAIKGSLRPEWNQDLTFDIAIPPGEVHDVQSWIDRQFITFSLLDLNDSGLVQHTEVVATTAVPLLRIMLSAKRPNWLVLRMVPTDSLVSEADMPVLEVSIVDNTQERFAWAKVVDAYTNPEEYWLQKDETKFISDLNTFGTVPSRSKGRKQAPEVKTDNPADDSPHNLWAQYNSVTRALRATFSRRTYPTFFLDEHNIIHPATAFVRPIVMHDPRVASPKSAALAVAQIPFRSDPIAPTGATRDARDGCASGCGVRAVEAGLAGAVVDLPICAVGGWERSASLHSRATECFFGMMNCPQTMIMRRSGSLMEHAILLCGLLLGLGLQAYVAVGKVKRRPYVWVVTITPKTSTHATEAVDDFAPCTISYFASDNDPPVVFFRSKFKHFEEARAIQDVNNRYRIIHWDPLTGSCFNSPRQPGYFFERIETLFNHQNLFFNIQRSDQPRRPFFSWNLHNLNHWIPFFVQNLTQNDPVKCSFSTPTSIMYPIPLHGVDWRKEDSYILRCIVEGIQRYRRHVLYIPETAFHRAASKHMYSFLARFEPVHARLLEQRAQHDYDPAAAQSSHHSQQSTQRRDSHGNGSHGLQSTAFLRDNSTSDLSGALTKLAEEEMRTFLPESWIYRGSVLLYIDADVDAIMESMAGLGLLDVSLSDTVWVAAVRVQSHPFGMANVWLNVGCMVNMGSNGHQRT
ncbi:hypothetical protein DFJ73DRAFT_968909 [Zopfochytrium polystomum]|nr:hypothetical protein DFJ73DRAFT_968909 [Zopfochytrium polystomum]